MDVSQYLDVFIDESTEHLDVLYNQLVELEKHPEEKAVMEEIFRAAHTIKGMSATMGFEDIAILTHILENVLDGIRYEKIQVEASTIDVLFTAVDHLNAMVENIANGGNGKRDVSEIVSHLEDIENGVEPQVTSPKDQMNDTKASGMSKQFELIDEYELAILDASKERGFTNYEISVKLRDDCLLKGARVFMIFEVLEQLGEVIKTEPSVTDLEEENFDYSFAVLLVSESLEKEISHKISKVSEVETVLINEFSPVNNQLILDDKVDKSDHEDKQIASNNEHNNSQEDNRQSAARKTIRVNIDRLDILMNLFEELVIDRGRLEQIALEIDHSNLQETVERMSRVSGDLQNVILNMRMVPVNTVFNRFPGMIRQIARDLHKNIKIEIIGAETELDRTVIDEIGDPLVHLIRNAADHGIERPDERKINGKPEQGTIKLQAYHSGNHIFIEIADDGAGIDKNAVINKAIEKGIINKEQAELYTDQQIFELIMASGFSTNEAVSDLSGRGVGLDVVKNTIETLGGNISIDSEVGQGSTFSIQLPLTLSIMSVLLVQLQKEKYAIPLSSIIETVIIPKTEILSAHNKKVIDFRGKVVPLVFLNTIFSVPGIKNEDEYISIVIVKRGDKTAGLVVDSLIGQHEVVLKSLGSYLTNVNAISGATILGDGEVALIIDSNALIK